MCNTLQDKRIGKPRDDLKPRLLKVTLPNKDMRENVMSNSPKIKNLDDPWKYVYINRDSHPVFQKENNRLRQKMNELRKLPEYAENAKERIKIMKGELKIDGVSV